MPCVFCKKETDGTLTREGLSGDICTECNKQLDNLSKYGTEESSVAENYFKQFEDSSKMGDLKYKDSIIKNAQVIPERTSKTIPDSDQFEDYTFHEPDSSKKYVVLQVTLKEGFIGTGSGNLWQLESLINKYADKGYRLHSFSTASAKSTGIMGGDRIQATMVFERMEMFI